MNKSRILYKLLYLIVIATVFTISSCNSDESYFLQEKDKGYLILDGVDISFLVDDISTRASIYVPLVSELAIKVVNSATLEELELEKGQTVCVLEEGSYTVIASYGENVCAVTPFLYGEADFDIVALQATNVGVTASLRSAVIHPAISDDLLLHYSSYELILNDGTSDNVLTNNEDYFVPAGSNYILNLSGTNQIEEETKSSWELNNLQAKTRYMINRSAELPSFSMPVQAEGNAWSKFIYITPMTVSDMITQSEIADKVINNVVYEASSDGGSTWIPSDVENGRIIIKGLQPSTTYTLRSKFVNVVSSNTQTLTTESAEPLVGGDMENWTYTDGPQASWPDRGPFWKLWYPRSTKDESTPPGWCTLNSLTTKDNDPKAYCSNSGTEQTTDKFSGNYAAEIKTIGWGDNNTAAGSGSVIYNTTPGQLFLGTIADINSPDYFFHFTTRPVKIAYCCKYIPKASRQYSVTCKVYNSNKELLGEYTYQEGAVSAYEYREFTLDYSIVDVKASYITLIFESGDNSHGELDKGAVSRGSRHTGNKLYIDDIKLLYE